MDLTDKLSEEFNFASFGRAVLQLAKEQGLLKVKRRAKRRAKVVEEAPARVKRQSRRQGRRILSQIPDDVDGQTATE